MTQPPDPNLPQGPLPSSGGPGATPGKGDFRTGPKTPPALLSATPNAAVLLRALRRRWLLAGSLGLMFAALAATATFFLVPPPKHTVRTMLRVPAGSFFIFKTTEPIPDLATHQRNQAAMIKSRLVLNSALRDPAVAKLKLVAAQVDSVEWLEKEVMVDFALAPEIMRISMHGHDTEELPVLVNAIRQAYLREVVDRDRSVRRERLAMLGEFREKYEGLLRTQRDSQREIEQKVGTGNASIRAQIGVLVEKELGMSESELLRTKFQLRKSELDLAVLKEREKKFSELKVPEEEIKAAIDRSPEMQKHDLEISRLNKLIAETIRLSAKGEKDLSVRAQRNRLRAAEKARDDDRQRLLPEMARRVRDHGRADLATQISLLRGQVLAMESLKAILEPEVERLQKRSVELNKHGVKLDAAKEDSSHLEEMTKRISSEESALKVELEVPSRVSVLEEAIVSKVSATTRLATLSALAGLAGLGLVLFGIAWLEHRARRVVAVDDVVGGLGMNLVGTLPDAARASRRLVGKGEAQDALAHSLLTESVDSCRAMLLHRARKDNMRVVMVTSAVSGEGKTSLCCHLAASLARAGLKTLLIDGDMRNPTIHRVFNVPREGGLCEMLRGAAPFDSISPAGTVKGLSILSAGDWDALTAQALAQGRLGDLLAHFRKQFDFILIDTSPVLPVSDALLIGEHVDGALISVLCQVSRLPSVYAAAQRIEALGVRALGAVINGTRDELYRSSQYPYMGRAKTPPAPVAPPAPAAG